MPLIVGGGPAGAAAAIQLSRAGLRPVVIERSATPADMLCGGFLSWNSVRLLEECNVDPLALGGHAIHRARLFAGRHVTELALPAPAVGLSRRRLDAALLDQAAAAGADIRRGVTVRGIDNGVVRYADGTSETPAHLILATGKHDVRGAARPAPTNDAAVGLRWQFPASQRLIQTLGDAIELHLFHQGYAGLVGQEDGAVNLCLAVRQSAFVRAGKRPDAMLTALLAQTPGLADRLADVAVGEAQAIANIPYGWRADGPSEGLYRIGDQIGVIPSIAGEGVGIAIATGMAAAKAIMAGVDPLTYQRACSRQIAPPIKWSGLIWSLAERPWLATMALNLLSALPGLGLAAMHITRVAGSPRDD
ncbi:FAD-dependent monooxygenase [Sphingobium sp. CR2-8]|uniref:NAD(P)/FAD-dependent oxidoreductase n=1 Tax=Sphingobium sp. CR2-8 TaxID=1306534 RepID=UPI002DB8E185|nr:FAD-dependent monooxygenase [Sphingobium sp. CR2-8]MEC3910851.1 FAD-dependent monooxygenase [Sphingobium sp. CR2-8]